MLRRLMCIRVRGSMVQAVPHGTLVHATPPGGSMCSGVRRHARFARKHVCLQLLLCQQGGSALNQRPVLRQSPLRQSLVQLLWRMA